MQWKIQAFLNLFGKYPCDSFDSGQFFHGCLPDGADRAEFSNQGAPSFGTYAGNGIER